MSVLSVEAVQQHRMLIDTHCHVHVSLDPAASAGCCCTSASGISNMMSDSSFDGSSVITSTERRNAQQQAEVADSDKEGRAMGSTTLPLPEIIRITMGIREDDWARAVRFGAAPDPDRSADNLRD